MCQKNLDIHFHVVSMMKPMVCFKGIESLEGYFYTVIKIKENELEAMELMPNASLFISLFKKWFTISSVNLYQIDAPIGIYINWTWIN